MFEYTCPKCDKTTSAATVQDGKVTPCPGCGQRLRLVREGSDEAGVSLLASTEQPAPPAPARPWGSPLLAGVCGLGGLTAAAGILLGWVLLGHEGSGDNATLPEEVAKNAAATPEPAQDQLTRRGTPGGPPAPFRAPTGFPRRGPGQTPAARGAVVEANLEELLKDLRGTDPEARKRAAGKLAQLGPQARRALPELLTRLRDPAEDKDVRTAVWAALARIGPPAADHLQALTEALADGSAPQARFYAADALGKLGPQARAAIPALVKALGDPERDVRRSAARALGTIGPEARDPSRAGLLAALQDREQDVRQAAVAALLAQGHPPATEAETLRALLADRSGPPEGRRYAARALGDLGLASVPALCEAVRIDPDVGVVRVAIGMLGTLKASTKEAADALAQAVTHAQPEVRVAAATALGQVGLDAVTFAAFLKAAGSKDVACRKAVLAALPSMGALANDPPRFTLPAGAVDDLIPALASDEPLARAVAAYLLGTLGPDAAAVAALRKALAQEKTPRVQVELLCALAEVGPAAREAVAELADIMRDPTATKNVQTCAALAVMRVTENRGKTAPAKPDKKITSARGVAYTLLAKALELTNCQRPDPIEKEIHLRAEKALQKGRRLAAEKIVDACLAFTGPAPDKVNARITALHVLEKIGSAARGTGDRTDSVFLLLYGVIRNQGRDRPEVVQAAQEAANAIGYRVR